MTSIAVVGAGYWAQNMLRIIHEAPNTELRHVCDLSQEALDAVQRRFPGVHTTTDFDAVVSDEEVDAVYIVTPPATHFDLASAALRAGKHVLVEKPLTTNSADAQALIELATLHQRVLMAGHTFLYSPPVLKVKELIDDGTMGQIFYIESSRVNLGRYQDSGVLWDLAPHDLSIILFWLGEVPSGVSANGRSFRSGDREDVVFLSLDFPSGAIAQLEVSWLAPVKLRRTTVSGSKRMAVYDDTAGPEAVKVYDHGVDQKAPESFGEFQLSYRQGDIWIPRLQTTEPLRAELDHFLHCIDTGEEPRSNGKQGLAIVKVLEAAERALRSHRREEIVWTEPRRFRPVDEVRSPEGILR